MSFSKRGKKKNGTKYLVPFLFYTNFVTRMGLEPMTPTLKVLCSTS